MGQVGARSWQIYVSFDCSCDLSDKLADIPTSVHMILSYGTLATDHARLVLPAS
jgi:hypothetical protein